MTKHKEPAGLRRWRLAHQHKKRRIGGSVARRRRVVRRYGRRRKGRKSGKGAIPLIQGAIVAYPVYQSYQQVGLTGVLPAQICMNLTGFNPTNNQFNKDTALKIGGALLVAQLVGSRIANRTGANRMLKKLTMGYLKVA